MFGTPPTLLIHPVIPDIMKHHDAVFLEGKDDAV
jgi:hypothetical protein